MLVPWVGYSPSYRRKHKHPTQKNLSFLLLLLTTEQQSQDLAVSNLGAVTWVLCTVTVSVTRAMALRAGSRPAAMALLPCPSPPAFGGPFPCLAYMGRGKGQVSPRPREDSSSELPSPVTSFFPEEGPGTWASEMALQAASNLACIWVLVVVPLPSPPKLPLPWNCWL